MGYELFSVKSIRIGAPTLTITSGGQFSLNADAGDLLRRVGTNFVQILWDADAYKVALRPLVKADESSYKISAGGKRRGVVFSGMAFLRYIGWDFSKPATMPVRWNEDAKVLEASLPRENILKAPISQREN